MQDRSRFGDTNGRFLTPEESRPWFHKINKFLYSPWYMILVAALTLLANVLGGEMVAYTAIIVIGIYTILFCRDMLPIMPFFICGYISPSVLNNPGRNSGSIFYPANGGLILVGMLALVLSALILRLSLDRSLRRKLFTAKRRLWIGFALLGVAYLLSGIGSKNYEAVYQRNFLFALLQFVSLAGLYWFFSGSVYWEKAPKNFFSWIGLMVGLVLVMELGNIYLTGNVIVDGRIKRDSIFTGWGNYNNLGALLAAMLPFPYYFASQSRKCPWIYHILGLLMLTGVVLSNSRGAILFAAMMYPVCMVLVLWKGKNRVQNAILYVATVVLAAGVLYVYRDWIMRMFSALINKKFASSGRDEIYIAGFQQFLRNPVFGGSFFPETEQPSWAVNPGFVFFFPPRWHNTLIQIAASCGMVGLVAYGIHRMQTAVLFWKKENRSMRNIFIGLSILVLLGTSLLDCHLFNVGPGLYYSMALAFAEHCVEQNP